LSVVEEQEKVTRRFRDRALKQLSSKEFRVWQHLCNGFGIVSQM
jgi:hypothetical protein